MTLDGFCDHTALEPDEEVHDHYKNLLDDGDVILYGRITYGLMEFWRTVLKTPTGQKDMDAFAVAIDKIPKIVFSNTMKNIDWESARLANQSLEEEISELKKHPDKTIFVGSRSLIMQLIKLNLIDEFQLCVHPLLAGSGLPLFENSHDRKTFKLIRTKTLNSGAVILYYEPSKELK